MICCSIGTFVVPYWKSQSYWPMLCSDGVHFRPFVIEWMLFSPRFIPGRFVSHSVFNGYASFDMLAIRMDFTGSFVMRSLDQRCLAGGCSLCM